MPELPEVQLTRENLLHWTDDALPLELQIVDPSLLKFGAAEHLKKSFAALNRMQLNRKGKLLRLAVPSGKALVIHLGMTGKFVLRDAKVLPLSGTRAVLRTEGKQEIRYLDPRRFGKWWFGAVGEVEKKSGWDRLGPDLRDGSLEGLVQKLLSSSSQRPVHSLLLDQRVVSGIGNIVANEGLFRSGVFPGLSGRHLSSADWEKLTRALKAVVEISLERDRGTEILYQGERGSTNPFQIYGRRGCPGLSCNASVETFKLGGRSVFFCPNCQRKEHWHVDG